MIDFNLIFYCICFLVYFIFCLFFMRDIFDWFLQESVAIWYRVFSLTLIVGFLVFGALFLFFAFREMWLYF